MADLSSPAPSARADRRRDRAAPLMLDALCSLRGRQEPPTPAQSAALQVFLAERRRLALEQHRQDGAARRAERASAETTDTPETEPQP
jgi:hypothetical protein